MKKKGLEIAKALAFTGCRVIIGCRNVIGAKLVCDMIQAERVYLNKLLFACN